MSSKLEIKYIKNCYIQANNAEAVPPLGTVLSNLGVNTVKFCEEFNKLTSELPKYFIVNTEIYIYENRAFKFKIEEPSITFFIYLMKYEKKIKVRVYDRYHEKIINCINIDDIVLLALYKFPKKKIQKAVSILLGTIKTMNLIILDDEGS